MKSHGEVSCLKWTTAARFLTIAVTLISEYYGRSDNGILVLLVVRQCVSDVRGEDGPRMKNGVIHTASIICLNNAATLHQAGTLSRTTGRDRNAVPPWFLLYIYLHILVELLSLYQSIFIFRI